MQQLNLTTNNLTIDEKTTDFAKKKFRKVLNLLPTASTINLNFNQENKNCRIDATIDVPGNHYHAAAVEASFFTCIKHLQEKLLRQQMKDKEKAV